MNPKSITMLHKWVRSISAAFKTNLDSPLTLRKGVGFMKVQTLCIASDSLAHKENALILFKRTFSDMQPSNMYRNLLIPMMRDITIGGRQHIVLEVPSMVNLERNLVVNAICLAKVISKEECAEEKAI